jgi:hypothetical protein
MFRSALPRQSPLAVITARTLNRSAAAAEQALRLQATGSLQLNTMAPGGSLSLNSPTPFYARITSGSGAGPYGWEQVNPIVGGGWAPGWLSSTKNSIEAYNNLAPTSITLPAYVLMSWTTAFELRFSLGTCPA